MKHCKVCGKVLAGSSGSYDYSEGAHYECLEKDKKQIFFKFMKKSGNSKNIIFAKVNRLFRRSEGDSHGKFPGSAGIC